MVVSRISSGSLTGSNRESTHHHMICPSKLNSEGSVIPSSHNGGSAHDENNLRIPTQRAPMRIMKAADGVQPSKFDAPALGDILRPELRTPPHSKIDTVMEDISEKHVLFSPLWGRFPALDWEWGFSETRGCLRGVITCQANLGGNWGRGSARC
jgi:hypothetical protein